MLIDSKSQLAKLLATENLTVEQRNVTTASFNLKDRTLTIPILADDLHPSIYDLFIGHEVGHALFTPPQQYQDAISITGIPKPVLNVVEDARIEKLIKRRFPGLKVPFLRAYANLMEQDFFEVKGVNLNTMNFLDRINLYFKVGGTLGIRFDETERELVKEIENAETFEDVIEICKKITKFMQEEQQKQQEEKNSNKKPGEKGEIDEKDDDGESSPTDEYSDFDENDENSDESGSQGDINEDDFDGQSEENEFSDDFSDEFGEEDGNFGQDDSYSEGPDENFDNESSSTEIKSHTDDAFRRNESSLIDPLVGNTMYATIPENINFNNVIIPYKTIVSRLKSELEHSDPTLYSQFKKKSNKVVSYLVKEFELRKNAEQMKRVSESKTGELNMNKIYAYQFSEDIFKRISSVPDGKSHGLVMYVDWSVSMSQYINETIKQLLNLVLFCKKLSIPFDVYAFTTNYHHDTFTDFLPPNGNFKGDNLMMGNKFNLMQLLSSKMNSQDFSYMTNALLNYDYRNKETGRMNYWPRWGSLGYTPLNETIICAMQMIPKFKQDNKLQIVNTVFLTDGDGHTLNERADSQRLFSETDGRVVFRHNSTKHQVRVKWGAIEMTSSLLKLLKLITDCNVVGFFLTSQYTFNWKVHSLFPKSSNYDDLRKEFKKNKSVVCESSGYDQFYIMKSDAKIDEDDEMVVKSKTTRGLVTALSKYHTGKVINRVILSKFIGMIS